MKGKDGPLRKRVTHSWINIILLKTCSIYSSFLLFIYSPYTICALRQTCVLCLRRVFEAVEKRSSSGVSRPGTGKCVAQCSPRPRAHVWRWRCCGKVCCCRRSVPVSVPRCTAYYANGSSPTIRPRSSPLRLPSPPTLPNLTLRSLNRSVRSRWRHCYELYQLE